MDDPITLAFNGQRTAATTGGDAFALNWSVSICNQLSRYSVASALALAVDSMAYMELVYSGIRAILAGIVGYTIGMIIHFVLSSRYVFDSSLVAKGQARLLLEFIASGMVGLGLTASLIWLMTEVMDQGPAIAKGTAVGVSFLAVFLMRRSVVFAARAGTSI